MDNLLSWFALKSVPGIGNLLFKRLIDRFISPEQVFNADPTDLLRVNGMNRRVVSSLKRHRVPDQVLKDLDLVIKHNHHVATLADPIYPPLLREIPDPPPFLYVAGTLEEESIPIAVVGSRNATPYGLSITRQLCRDLSDIGITVVSGMALGIDSAAHTGALLGAGPTVAVLGSGLGNIYPRENRRLYSKIIARGAVITEFPVLAEPEAHHFPIRNRVISGMALGTLVVEATKKSGSLITARLAADQNREVYAVPGNIQSFKSTGTHTLIKQGAKLVEHAQDIVEELAPDIRSKIGKKVEELKKKSTPPPSLTEEEKTVYDALGTYPLHIDDLMKKLSLPPGKLSSTLLQLELKGIVQQAPGKYFLIQC